VGLLLFHLFLHLVLLPQFPNFWRSRPVFRYFGLFSGCFPEFIFLQNFFFHFHFFPPSQILQIEVKIAFFFFFFFLFLQLYAHVVTSQDLGEIYF